MAITIDDLPTVSVLGQDLGRAEQTTRELLAAIKRAQVPAIGFVNEGKLQLGRQIGSASCRAAGAVARRRARAGQPHLLASRSARTELKAFQRPDPARRGRTKRLLAAKGQKPRYFRHPFLHTGRSLEVRDGLVAFLKEHGYAVAPVTVDNSDYIFAAAYDRTRTGPGGDTVKAAYLDYMEAVGGLLRAAVGRDRWARDGADAAAARECAECRDAWTIWSRVSVSVATRS